MNEKDITDQQHTEGVAFTSQRVVPTGRDATARRVQLDGNLSFDQP